MLASKFPFSTPERKSSWQGITETWMTGRPNAASLWGTLIRQCITMSPKLDHSRLAKLSPRLLAAQQRLGVADKTSASRDRLGPFWGPPLQMWDPMRPVADLLDEADRAGYGYSASERTVSPVSEFRTV